MTQVGTGCQLDPGLRRDDDMADSPPTEGGTTEWWGGSKSIRVKIAKVRAHWDIPQFYPLQENQGFFATNFGQNQKLKSGGNPPKNFFIFVKKCVAKKPWFFYDVHE